MTTVQRTIRDLGRTADAETVRRAIRQAEFLGLPLGEIETDRTRSPLESDFLGFSTRHRLPKPEVNAPVGIYRVDFLWRRQRFAIEADGWAAHRGRQAFEDDRARGLELMRRGVELLRLTQRQLKADPLGVAVVVRERLGRAPA